MFGGRGEDARPRLCPACSTLVGIKATRCHECGTSLNFSLAAASKSLSGILGGETPITSLILIVNILLFGVSMLATARATGALSFWGNVSGQVLLDMGARQSILIFSGEVWRLVTPMFLHAGLLHFGMNTLFLVDIGPQVEQIYGSARYLFLYVMTGICSFIASVAWNVWTSGGYGIGIGASGARAGLIGVMLAMTTGRGGTYARVIRSQMIRMVGYLVVMALLPIGIDNAAHFGGLAAGFGLGKIFSDREPMNSTERNRAYALGWIAGITVVASLVIMVVKNIRGQ
jgi:membrane associated rhomboid family serine protease